MLRKETETYEDMIGLPHPKGFPGHPPMEAAERAAQFSPFAALSGYEEAVRETERTVEEREIKEDKVAADAMFLERDML